MAVKIAIVSIKYKENGTSTIGGPLYINPVNITNSGGTIKPIIVIISGKDDIFTGDDIGEFSYIEEYEHSVLTIIYEPMYDKVIIISIVILVESSIK